MIPSPIESQPDPNDGGSRSANARDDYSKFLLAEYSNIAQAFFNSGTTITQFFQYYLLALSVPITLAGVILKVTAGSLNIEQLQGTATASFLASFLLAIAFAGLCMMAYIINI